MELKLLLSTLCVLLLTTLGSGERFLVFFDSAESYTVLVGTIQAASKEFLHKYPALNGVAVECDEIFAEKLKDDDRIILVERDGFVSLPDELVDNLDTMNMVLSEMRDIQRDNDDSDDQESAAGGEPFRQQDPLPIWSRKNPEELAKDFEKEWELENVNENPSTRVIQANATWNLRRLGARRLPLPDLFVYPLASGNTTDIYIVDTGVMTTHAEFDERAMTGKSFVADEANTDLHGHGTHVAGIAAGRTLGVAKRASIIPVKVLNSLGSGSWSGIIAGIDWVLSQVALRRRPSVMNLSVEGAKNTAVEFAVATAVFKGIHVTVAAGNKAIDACGRTPAGGSATTDQITVGNSNVLDVRSRNSNYGPCVTLFAPGESILSAGISGGTRLMTGTSMSAPHVAGIISTYLSIRPTLTPNQMKKIILGTASRGTLKDIFTSLNLLAYLDQGGCRVCVQRKRIRKMRVHIGFGRQVIQA